MIKLNYLKVEGFKSLIKTEIEIFGDTNMFYGFNNSGKSNVFKFLKVLFERKKDIQRIEVEGDKIGGSSTESLETIQDFWNGKIYNEPFLFSNNEKSVNIKFEVGVELGNSIIKESGVDYEELGKHGYLSSDDFTVIKLIGEIESQGSNDSYLFIKDAYLNGKEFYKFHDSIEYYFEGIDELDKTDGEPILSLMNDCVLFIDTDRNFRKELLKDTGVSMSPDSFKNWMFELNLNVEKNKQFVGLTEFLRDFDFTAETKSTLSNNLKSFPFSDSTNIGFTKLGDEIEIMLENESGRFPVKSFGTGIQQFFYLMARIFMNESRIIIIEELELNLAPLYQIELLRFLKQLMPDKCDQILFSSHSPFFTKKNSNMVDVVQHVQINNAAHNGTNIESHEEWTYLDDINESYFSMLYS